MNNNTVRKVEVYEKREYQSPFKLMFIMIICMIAFIILFDFLFDKYKSNKFINDSKNIFTSALNNPEYKEKKDYEEYMLRELSDKKYSTKRFELIEIDQKKYLFLNNNQHLSVLGSISFGLIKNEKNTTDVAFLGYFNEYNEVVIEEYKEDYSKYLE